MTRARSAGFTNSCMDFRHASRIAALRGTIAGGLLRLGGRRPLCRIALSSLFQRSGTKRWALRGPVAAVLVVAAAIGFAAPAIAQGPIAVIAEPAREEVISDTIEAAVADADAAEAALGDLQSTIAADIADAYVLLRGLQAQRAVAVRNTQNLGRTMELVGELRAVGRVTDLDLDQARAQLLISEAAIPPLDAALADAASRLAVLTGRTPSAGMDLLSEQAALPLVDETIAIGDPAMLLRRRPDIAVAERLLAAATARIGLNVAEAFPRVDLLGDVGVRAIGVDNLFASTALNFAIGPQISWSVTDLVRARDRIEGAEATAAAAFASYEQSVLNALAETEAALAAQARLQERYAKLSEAEAAATAAASVAPLRYEAGRVDFLQVLDTERVALTTANEAAAARTEIARAQVAVFRALRAGAPPAPTRSD